MAYWLIRQDLLGLIDKNIALSPSSRGGGLSGGKARVQVSLGRFGFEEKAHNQSDFQFTSTKLIKIVW